MGHPNHPNFGIFPENPKKAILWLKKLGNPYSEIAIDKDGTIAIDWGVYGIPETFLVNSKGIIKYRHVGPVTKKTYKKINLIIKLVLFPKFNNLLLLIQID